MTADAYPVDWGEPPPTPEEESTAAVLERVMEALERGETPWPQEELARDLEVVRRCATAFHRHAGLLDDSRSASAQTLTPSEAAASCPEVLPDPFPGEYRLLKRLGRGAFGEVWLAEDLNLGWQVALKTLRLAGAGTLADRLAALRHEARTLGGLRHRNIVQVHAWRQAGDEHYLVMQYVPGGSLEDRVRQYGPLP